MRKNSDPNRVSRLGCLGLGIVLIVVLMILKELAVKDSSMLGSGLYFVVSLFFVPIAWMRLKDAGQNPWWSLGIVVPLVNLAVAIWCICAPSKKV
jgi:uncharacterized membrane protein YhaH (DUF805 family)